MLDSYVIILQVLQKFLPGGFCGFDKEGSPVHIEQYGNLDMKGILYSAKKLDIEKTKLLQGEETMRLLSQQTKKVGISLFSKVWSEGW